MYGESRSGASQLPWVGRTPRAVQEGVSGGFAEGTVHLKHLAWIAWDGSRRAGRTVPLFDEFVDKLEDLDVTEHAAPLAGTE